MTQPNLAGMTPMSPTINAISHAITEVMSHVKGVKKGGVNKFSNYTFMRDVDVVVAVRAEMQRVGLVLLPEFMSSTYWQNGKNNHCRIEVRWRVLHAPSGEYLTLMTVGDGSDTLDKGAYKAMTGAKKYAIQSLFLLPSADDPEEFVVRNYQGELEEQFWLLAHAAWDRGVAADWYAKLYPNGTEALTDDEAKDQLKRMARETPESFKKAVEGGR